MHRISTGVGGLDKMLRGGVIAERPYVVTGPPGSGKSILAMHFLLEGRRRGEPCMLVALDEPPSEFKANMAAFGWNLDQITVLDATPDIRAHRKSRSIVDVGTTLDVQDMERVRGVRRSQPIRAIEVTIHSVQKIIKQSAHDLREETGKRYSRIVIDSMTSLKRFSLHGEDARILVQSFLRFLSELEATSFIVSNPLNSPALEAEFLLSRGEIQIHRWIDGHAVRRAISIDRMRGTPFDDRLRPVEIGPRGITVYPNAAVDANGSPIRATGGSLLEGRIAGEVAARIDEVLAALEHVRKAKGETAEAQSTLLRAVVAFHRNRYEEALRYLVTAKARLAREKRLRRVVRRAQGKRR